MTNLPVFKAGENITVQKKVVETDTTFNPVSGTLDNVFATPSLVALMIGASVRLIDDKLGEGIVSVGRKLCVSHDKTTVVGAIVTLKVTVVEQVGNRIELAMEAFDESGQIATGEHTRTIEIKKDNRN